MTAPITAGEESAHPAPRLGILGGMGPLASAAFLSTIYRHNVAAREQETPACILLSDPSLPDRTEVILSWQAEAAAALVAALARGLADLRAAGAERLLIACVTAHHFVPALPPELRQRIISLIDLALERLAAETGRFVFLATTGTRQARIFESHELWRGAADRLVMLAPADQEGLHSWLYQLKLNAAAAPLLAWLGELRQRYQAAGFLFGCTELHLLQQPLAERAAGSPGLGIVIDPLQIAAERLRSLLEPAACGSAGG
jgi:aspartate racemase